MRNKEKNNKKKYTTNTYMKEAIDYDIHIYKEDDMFITVKKYKKMTNPVSFMVEDQRITYIDEGYTLLEITPLKEHYNIRYYFDQNNNYIDSYIDVILENGEEFKIPYYIDLYLDVLHNPKTDTYYFVDEEELLEAYQQKRISKKDYEFAYQIGNKILKQLNNHTFPWNYKDYMRYL